jgi:hypothetical protein
MADYYICPDCRARFRGPAKLLEHQRAKHSDSKGENRAAIEVTLAELKRGGRLDPIDEAKVQMVRSLADQLDLDPTNAQMWRTYAEALGVLLGADNSPDEFDKLKEEILSRAPVGNTPEA